MFAGKSSKNKYTIESDAVSDQRSGSPLSDFVDIEKSGEQPNGTGIKSIDGSQRISPTSSSVSMSSEAESTASGTKVCILIMAKRLR